MSEASHLHVGPDGDPAVISEWPYAAFALPHRQGYLVVDSADRTHPRRTGDLVPLGLHRTSADAELAGYTWMTGG